MLKSRSFTPFRMTTFLERITDSGHQVLFQEYPDWAGEMIAGYYSTLSQEDIECVH